MEKKKEMCTKRNTGLVRTLYVISVILLLIFIFMLIESIGYVRSYIAAYGMPAVEIIKESIQYIVKDSLNYFVYALLVFCAAKTINIVSCKSAVSNAVEPSNAQTESAVADNQCLDIEPAEDIVEIEQVVPIEEDKSDDIELPDSTATEEIEDDPEQPVLTDAEDENDDVEQAVPTDEDKNGDIEQLELTDEDKNGDIELPDLTETEEIEVNAESENIEATDNQCSDIEPAEYVEEADMEADSENEDYRFEPDKVISRLGEINRKPEQKKIVEEAIGGQSQESEEER